MNRRWHAEHRMPERPTLAQRVAWHREHARHCACRPIPESLRERMGRPEDRRAGGSRDPRSR